MRIILGVSGGIAAYKAAEIARALIRDGHQIQTVLTRGAEEFIRPLTFAALTGRKVITDLFASSTPDATLSSSVEHIGVARENDLLLVAPATADVLAKFAHGLADDFLSTVYLAFKGRVVLAPAMNNEMWSHPATRANFEVLRSRGHVIVKPEDGYLACGAYGPGRLAENDRIVAAVSAGGDLDGQTILVTAGPTREPIDPVRFLSNRSSGKMGYSLATAAIRRGARVILVTGPVELEPPAGAEVVRVETAQQMYDAVFAHLAAATAVIKCAAVADYRPASATSQKMKKTGAGLTLELEPTADILSELGRRKGSRTLIGFAAETENVREYAMGKLASKNCDVVVANYAEQAFDSETNQAMLVTRNGVEELPRLSKPALADRILDCIRK